MSRARYDHRMEVDTLTLNRREVDPRVKGVLRAGGGQLRNVYRVIDKERGHIRLGHWIRRSLAAKQSLAHRSSETLRLLPVVPDGSCLGTEPELQTAKTIPDRVSQFRVARERRYPWLSPPTLSFLKRLHDYSTLAFLRRKRSGLP